ncbi:MAG TPA: histidine kinase [Terriglobia bacterium]|jgi:two-component system sensor histidine kinase KdpD|nr:histidine kinase [Terriglobia bacterium]
MAESVPRGRLKILLGYAAGVGKTYKMLEEAHDLKRRGLDVVVGYFEPHGRKDTIARLEGLEVIPRRRIEYRGVTFEEMDTEAILRRRPQSCAVDEFAHTNVPGSERAKRWEDVQVLLGEGIDVVTTMNVQHLESLNDQVWQFSGVRVRETIPDWVVQQADQVVLVDLPPDALLNRLKRGAVYSPEKARIAAQNFFRESTLAALREMALRQTAHEVEGRYALQEPEELVAAEARSAGTAEPPVAETRDRILIAVTADPASAALIRRGKRVADYLHADCFVAFVHPRGDPADSASEERKAVEKHLNFARSLRIETRVLEGEDVAETLVDFARLNRITQVFLARPRKPSRLGLLRPSLVQQIVRLARDMQVTVVAERHRSGTASAA